MIEIINPSNNIDLTDDQLSKLTEKLESDLISVDSKEARESFYREVMSILIRNGIQRCLEDKGIKA